MKNLKRFQGGPLAWMAAHPVAANLLMIVAIIGGILMISHLRQEVFPDFEHDEVRVSVAYPGASPEEIEKGIVLPIEEAVSGVDGVKRVVSNASEGVGSVTVEAQRGYDLQQLQNDVQNAINRIRTFPTDIERPRVVMRSYEKQTISLMLYGDSDRLTLYNLALSFKQRLLQHPEISKVGIYGVSALQYSIEIDKDTLRKYNLSLEEVARRINSDSLDLPAGSIKTSSQEILVRLNQRRELIEKFKNIPIITTKSGAIVTLKDIAKFRKNFENEDYFALYNSKPAIYMAVRNPQDYSPIAIANIVKEEMANYNSELPQSIDMKVLTNSADTFADRVNLLLKNSAVGLIIVLVVLALFLEIRLAFWVMMGIPISFMGAFFLFPALDVSISMVSLFAFIIALGIVVDDAIVIGENIYHYREQGFSPVEAAVKGVREMAVPVTFAILTNIVAFLPIYFIPGMIGKIFQVIPVVVIIIFLVSWVESLFILPSHLAHIKGDVSNPLLRFIHNLQQKFSRAFRGWVRFKFGSFLTFVLHHRYLLIVVSISMLIVTIAYALSGRMGMQIFPRVPSDYAQAILKMPLGTPADETKQIVKRMTDAAYIVEEEKGLSEYIHGVYARVGSEGAHEALIRVYLPPAVVREKLLSTADFVQLWREKIGEIPGAELLKFSAHSRGPGHGSAISLEIKHSNLEILKEASRLIAQELHNYPRVYDISDGFESGKPQINFTLKPLAYTLGFDARTIAREVRASFYGAESQRILVDNNEIKVMVKLPKKEREMLQTLYNLRLFTKDGKEVALMDLINIRWGQAYTQIHRVNGRRVITVEANIRPRSKAIEVMNDLQESFLPELKKRFPGLSYSFEGDQTEIRDSLSTLKTTFILAMFVIYALLAIPFRSYLQPLIVMVGIPFGIIGAIIGHLIMDYSLSVVSMFGIVALSGIVVNDALILVDFANRYKSRVKASTLKVVREAALQRFRPILLTTITTFGGLMPMIFETSRQAKFLIPMAISLGFGILFATFVTLLIVPALYMVVEDVKSFFTNH
ncbi:efflux RND transporter permease subunit [Hydrogenimonas thermophila]|uniref:Multidrug efflux pump subunit AcrB n=1 Tax=Hydrogenimonas thermophila TaxID=223786 RepID=A0A1I5SF59_9BACT|nr:efflux RND transporter permease subunit [Hydrogenimonas thermophila]SFP69332.1 Multidrug efflux pump subunit AcrB [Hydrogenimonas thermophila]